MLCLQLVALPPSGHKINKWCFNKKCKLPLPPSWSKIYSLVNVRADLPTLSPSPHTSAVLHSCWLWLVTKPFALLLLQEYLRSWDFKYQQIPALRKPCLVLSINSPITHSYPKHEKNGCPDVGLLEGYSSLSVVSRLPLIHQFSMWLVTMLVSLLIHFEACLNNLAINFAWKSILDHQSHL